MNRVDYLRISLIDRCNFRCQYCLPEGAELNYILRQELLTHEEIILLLETVFIPLGFCKFRLTGGEPLLRPGIVELVNDIASLSATEDLSLTTNGFFLSSLAQDLYNAGLKRINISLDSLNPETFATIIGHHKPNFWQQTWSGIQTAYEVGFDPLKLNVVVIPGVNENEIEALAELSIERNWHIRFIEFMPIGNPELFNQRAWVPSEEIRQKIRQKWGLIESNIKGNGPADIFQIPGAKGTIGFISQMSECFCDRCNRMRLSADGLLRPCLLNETGQIDLKSLLRQGINSTEIKEKVAHILEIKPDINYKERDSGNEQGIYQRTMSQIGG